MNPIGSSPSKKNRLSKRVLAHILLLTVALGFSAFVVAFGCDFVGISVFIYPDFSPGCVIENVEIDGRPWTQFQDPGTHSVSAVIDGKRYHETRYLSNWHGYLRISCDGQIGFASTMIYPVE